MTSDDTTVSKTAAESGANCVKEPAHQTEFKLVGLYRAKAVYPMDASVHLVAGYSLKPT